MDRSAEYELTQDRVQAAPLDVAMSINLQMQQAFAKVIDELQHYGREGEGSDNAG